MGYLLQKVNVLRFLLEDLQKKLKLVLAPRKRATFLPTANKSHAESSISNLTPVQALKKLQPIFPGIIPLFSSLIVEALCTHMERVAGKLTDDSDDNPQEWIHFVPCLMMMMDCFERLFSFEDFQNPENEEFFKVSDRLEALILKELLHSITNKKKTKHFPPLLQLRLDAFEYFYAFTKVAAGQLNSELSHL